MNEFIKSRRGEEKVNDAVIAKNEVQYENTIRPKNFKDYVGQSKVKENLTVYVKSAQKRQDALDHVLLYGPPGLGKTTLAHILAAEMGANIKVTSGPAIEKTADIAALLTGLSKGDILFIDEIHRLKKTAEEILYPAMEDFVLDIVMGEGSNSKSMRIPLEKFTLIGATTKAGSISAPLRDRFGVVERLELYTADELNQIVKRTAKVLEITISDEASKEISKRSRGTPRIANRLIKRVRDFVISDDKKVINLGEATYALDRMEIDSFGLDSTDKRILDALANKFKGTPVGLETLASITGEDSETIEDMYEPYLMQQGLVARTPRGRVITEEGKIRIKQ